MGGIEGHLKRINSSAGFEKLGPCYRGLGVRVSSEDRV